MRYCCELNGYFHGVNAGSNPAGDANKRKELAKILGEIVGIPAIDRMEFSHAVDGTTVAPTSVGMYRIL